MDNHDNHKHSGHHHGSETDPAKEEAKKKEAELKDSMAEKTKHGHEKAMDHSQMDHSKMDHVSGDHSDHNPAHGQMGHDHHKMMIADYRKRFWVTLVLTIPILFFSPMIQDFFGYEYLLPGNPYILFALSSVVYQQGFYTVMELS